MTSQLETTETNVVDPTDAGAGPLAFQIRPGASEQRVRPAQLKQLISEVLNACLSGHTYAEQDTPELCKNVSDRLQTAIAQLPLHRYKVVVHTVIGEQRGSGVKVGAKCLWDADTDKYVSEVFISESLFCVATLYMVYYY